VTIADAEGTLAVVISGNETQKAPFSFLFYEHERGGIMRRRGRREDEQSRNF